MSQKLYKLKHGKISRKDHLGNRVTLLPGIAFVPSPTEFESEQFRLESAGTVEDSSIEVLAAKQNTNWTKTPNAFGGRTAAELDIEVPENITSVKGTEEALNIVMSLSDEATLDKFMQQELQNKPRVRKVIVQTIEKRKVEIEEAQKVS